jgi:hypothetical protein
VAGRDRYNGPLWTTLRAVDPDERMAKVAFLSAHLGFRDANTPVDPYEKRMTRQTADEMIAGGLIAGWPKTRKGMGGMHAGCEIGSMSKFGRIPFDEVCIVGGHLYIDVMRSFVCAFKERGHVRRDAPLVEINGQIGYMRRDLRSWLLGGVQGAGDAGVAPRSRIERAQAIDSANAYSCAIDR